MVTEDRLCADNIQLVSAQCQSVFRVLLFLSVMVPLMKDMLVQVYSSITVNVDLCAP